ncbi:MAG: hypothetical protein JSW26_00850 [Desulfobacterales bacterium]|nr:MAG: hypothetical protein JSW26_00850 [Desulfobacterales bacterium]
MKPRRRILFLILIMSSIVLVVEAITIAILYQTAIAEEKTRLEETAKSQARLIEAVARFDKVYNKNFPYGARQATLHQIKDAHSKYRGFGKTGEFTLSKRENDQIVFVLSHRHHDLREPMPIPWNSDLAEPMRLALSGKSGTIIGLDYRGEKVLAAYEPVAELNLGIVAKLDLSEIRAPFVKAAFISGLSAIVVIVSGAGFFIKITDPILKRLQKTVAKLEKALAEVKTLRGILPICSFCKKIRDDDGYWNQVEVYVKERSAADFSHGICPDCMKEYYPEEYDAIDDKNLIL